MREILNAIESRGDRAVFEALSVPATYRAALIRKEDVEMFAGKSPGRSAPQTLPGRPWTQWH
jgi:hypothetical protein